MAGWFPLAVPAIASGFSQLKIGAGGLQSGINIANDNEAVVRCDVYGAYIWDSSLTTPQGNAGGTGAWRQLVTSTSMPSGFVDTEGEGVFEIVFAPSNSQIMYMVYRNYIFRSSNKGVTWTQTASSGLTLPLQAPPNDGSTRGDGQKLAIDPNDINTVLLGTQTAGLYVTHDGGATWSNVAGVAVPTNSHGVCGICFDPSSGTNGSGYTNTAYCLSNGRGTYRTTNGSTWSSITTTPTTGRFAALSANGYYWCDNDADLWRYNGTATKLYSGSFRSIAIKPTDATVVILADFSGNLFYSTNSGTSFTAAPGGWTVSATDVPWLGISMSLTVYAAMFDKVTANRIHFTTGIGMMYVDLAALPLVAAVTWIDRSVGIENLVANDVVIPPVANAKPVVSAWDRATFYKGSDSYPSTYGPSPTFCAGWLMDYASSSPSTMVIAANWPGTELSGISTDSGQTWAQFASMTPNPTASLFGGQVAAASPTNIIWALNGGVQPWYTKNGGTSWSHLSITGPTWSEYNGNVFGQHVRDFCADRVNANTFYFVYNPTPATTGVGVYKSTDSGDNWTKVFTGQISGTTLDRPFVAAVPGVASYLLYTGGLPGSPLATENTGFHFMKSTDGGTTWSLASGGSPTVNSVYVFGFGAPAQGHSNVSIYIVGWVGGVYGIWRSIDNMISWTQLATYPLGLLDAPRCITGDPNNYGYVYIGFGGNGFVKGYFP